MDRNGLIYLYCVEAFEKLKNTSLSREELLSALNDIQSTIKIYEGMQLKKIELMKEGIRRANLMWDFFADKYIDQNGMHNVSAELDELKGYARFCQKHYHIPMSSSMLISLEYNLLEDES